MKIKGAMLIGKSEVVGTQGTIHAFNPAAAAELEPAFGVGSEAEIDRACTLAKQAFDSFRETSLADRARFLRRIGQGILDLGDTLIERAQAETGLPKGRIEGERGRTVGQLEMFASIVEKGLWIGAVLDSELPERKPQPRPDLRQRKVPLGPVAVFAASNFPLAFSVAGGDTASALAAGCPVIVKSHSSHLGTSELVGRVIQQAVAECGLPEGVFSLVLGKGNVIGQALVSHPAIKAVGFTGSRQGGVSLMKTAASRPEPIPVYAEMSSINPLFLFPSALEKNAESIAKGFVDSMTLGVGQFCTNPGIVIGIESSGFDRFRHAAEREVAARASATMLSPAIHTAYQRGVERLASAESVETLAKVEPGEGNCLGSPALFSVAAKHILSRPELAAEVFGPSSIVISCTTAEEMRAIAEWLEGQLTVSLFTEEEDLEMARQLMPVLERKAGRIIFNGYPTGVEVCWSMVHGGPFPATSDSRTTSVGGRAIERFLRPVCYQGVPSALLPESLQDSNPLKIPRIRDTKIEQS
ncbi:MAG TPA: aldehyde dehydrogenase (NADP(+)) [Acidisarcina sp.]|nr:aldehyde dehydrogenase (NADP(+)) [Acidisarcina sp.]